MNHRVGLNGVVLPVVLIMLVVLAFAGLLAARRGAGLQEVSTNARVRQSAEFSAQTALRQCEAIVIDVVDNHGVVHGEQHKRFGSKELTDTNDADALWRNPDNWMEGAAHPIRVDSTNTEVSSAAQRLPPAHCLIEPMRGDRYLITARGLSAGARFDKDGRLEGGSEIWLQSVISPKVPVRSGEGGYE